MANCVMCGEKEYSCVAHTVSQYSFNMKSFCSTNALMSPRLFVVTVSLKSL